MTTLVSRKIEPTELIEAASKLRDNGYELMMIAASSWPEPMQLHYIFALLDGEGKEIVDLTVSLTSNQRVAITSLGEIFHASMRSESDIEKRSMGLIRFRSSNDQPPTPVSLGGASGISQIPVGPVHAGVIEPGHFRFTVVGESILTLEVELGFLTRGVEEEFIGKTLNEALSLAEHITGDSIIAHGLALLKAHESSKAIEVSEAEKIRRSLLLELERVINHITDIGALANDAAFALANSQALRIRERVSNINHRLTNHRLLRGALSAKGTTIRELPSHEAIAGLKDDIAEVVSLVEGHGIVHDRMQGTGFLSKPDAKFFSTRGYVARASGYSCDLRTYLPYNHFEEDYQEVLEVTGDVMGRFRVRAREALTSLDLIECYVEYLQEMATTEDAPIFIEDEGGSAKSPSPQGFGFGCVEGWRGATSYFVEVDDSDLISRITIVDPSANNWKALPVALHNSIVPDFPLINKSFNQSYAGNDL
ncbi:MAG: formate hydrogenase [Actinomycetota bacterium]|nr:formate hydrogenase [Actinomycetota bacterium]